MEKIIILLLTLGVLIAILSLVFVSIQETETFKAIDRRIAEKLERRNKNE